MIGDAQLSPSNVMDVDYLTSITNGLYSPLDDAITLPMNSPLSLMKDLFGDFSEDLDLSSPVLEMCSPLETPPETPEVKDQCADTDTTQPQPSEGDDSQDVDQTLIDLFIKTLGDKFDSLDSPLTDPEPQQRCVVPIELIKVPTTPPTKDQPTTGTPAPTGRETIFPTPHTPDLVCDSPTSPDYASSPSSVTDTPTNSPENDWIDLDQMFSQEQQKESPLVSDWSLLQFGCDDHIVGDLFGYPLQGLPPFPPVPQIYDANGCLRVGMGLHALHPFQNAQSIQLGPVGAVMQPLSYRGQPTSVGISLPQLTVPILDAHVGHVGNMTKSSSYNTPPAKLSLADADAQGEVDDKDMEVDADTSAEAGTTESGSESDSCGDDDEYVPTSTRPRTTKKGTKGKQLTPLQRGARKVRTRQGRGVSPALSDSSSSSAASAHSPRPRPRPTCSPSPQAAPRPKKVVKYSAEGKRIYTCPIPGCLGVVARSPDMNRHFRTKHNGYKWHCEEQEVDGEILFGCRKAFTRMDALQRHRKISCERNPYREAKEKEKGRCTERVCKKKKRSA